MRPTVVPARSTIDFRDALHPSRTWILGLSDEGGRAELLAFDGPPPVPAYESPLATSCMCPDFCELDHAND